MKLTILVTNDDGYAAPGIDTMVQSLVKLPDVSVTVVAPLANQSGSGAKTTAGALTATNVKTASGYPAIAVAGFPADTIRYALSGVLHTPPDLVVSGINNGSNPDRSSRSRARSVPRRPRPQAGFRRSR